VDRRDGVVVDDESAAERRARLIAESREATDRLGSGCWADDPNDPQVGEWRRMDDEAATQLRTMRLRVARHDALAFKASRTASRLVRVQPRPCSHGRAPRLHRRTSSPRCSRAGPSRSDSDPEPPLAPPVGLTPLQRLQVGFQTVLRDADQADARVRATFLEIITTWCAAMHARRLDGEERVS